MEAALIISLALLAMYLPTLYDLVNNIWWQNEQTHGPLVLLIFIWLLWKVYKTKSKEDNEIRNDCAVGVGLLLLVVSCLVYVLGRSQSLLILEVCSASGVLAGLILIYMGRRWLRWAWFPLFFLTFLAPLPPLVVDAVTQPMKIAVSATAEHILFGFNYPVARAGVILQIGQYQLLVADACAGLQTLFTLEAMGLLYINLAQHASAARNMSLGLAIIPVSFAANVTRVMVLTLVTYYFGDEIGQGFIHGFAGIVLFLSALVLIVGIDSAIGLIGQRREKFS